MLALEAEGEGVVDQIIGAGGSHHGHRQGLGEGHPQQHHQLGDEHLHQEARGAHQAKTDRPPRQEAQAKRVQDRDAEIP